MRDLSCIHGGEERCRENGMAKYIDGGERLGGATGGATGAFCRKLGGGIG